MKTECFKMPLIRQHSIVDYLRVAIIAAIVLVTIFILRMLGNRADDGKKKIQEHKRVPFVTDV